jgi:putative transposase
MTGRKIAPICRVLGVGRASAYRGEKPRGPRYSRADDRVVTAQIREVIRTRATYGSRRTCALVNRAFGTGYNGKRIRRVMDIAGWKLPKSARRRTGRAHTGQVQRPASNERWCSDVLEIACWNSEYIQLGFVLDCHDRECLAWTAAPRDLLARDIQQLMHAAVAQRFGVGRRPDAPIQFLSDNGSIYTALDTICTAERLNLEPITTPKSSPQSNGMSEAFVNTLKRDYVSGADRCAAAVLLDQAMQWIEDYNAIAPHSALGYRSPWQYRSEVLELV